MENRTTTNWNEGRAYVLLSGGLDSTVVASMLVEARGPDRVTAISFIYGQRHSVELEAAKAVAADLGIEHRILSLEGIMGIGGLTDADLEVPKVSYADLPIGISPTYVPFRNGLLLAAVTSQAMADPEANCVAYGAHAEDAENDAYPDCNEAFINSIASAIKIGTYAKIDLLTPFAHSTKADVVRNGVRINAPMELSWSCYEGGKVQCGICSTCRARREAFTLALVEDQTEYAE